ncbi:MAG: hypothetical protein ACRC2K_08835 [Clostridium sp.]
MKNKIKSLILCLILLFEGGVILKSNLNLNIKYDALPVVNEVSKVQYEGSEIIDEMHKKGGEVTYLERKGEEWEIKVNFWGSNEEVKSFIDELKNYNVKSYSLIYENNTYNIDLSLSTT